MRNPLLRFVSKSIKVQMVPGDNEAPAPQQMTFYTVGI